MPVRTFYRGPDKSSSRRPAGLSSKIVGDSFAYPAEISLQLFLRIGLPGAPCRLRDKHRTFTIDPTQGHLWEPEQSQFAFWSSPHRPQTYGQRSAELSEC